MKVIHYRLLFALSLMVFSLLCRAELTDEIQDLRSEWAHIKYELNKDRQEKAIEQLAEKAAMVRKEQDNQVEVHIWEGIILSTWAGIKGGLGALGLVKRAKTAFEQAIEMDASAMDGSALTSLGSLYYQVPGWPLGFGDRQKAEEYLVKGLELNPDGIDSNFFYGDFLMEQGDYNAAEQAFERALNAPDRPGRPLADKGRREETRQALARVRAAQSMAKKNEVFK